MFSWLTWAAVKMALGKVWEFIKLVPWYIWAGIVSVIIAWWLISSAISAADQRGFDRSEAKWTLAMEEAKKAAAKELERVQALVDTRIVEIKSSADQRVAELEKINTKQQGELRAIRNRKPID